MKSAVSQLSALTYEAEVIEGLEDIARAEIARIRGVSHLEQFKGAVTFDYTGGDTRLLTQLDTVIAVYRTLTMPVPRPKALLGHQYYTAITQVIEDILSQKHTRGKFQSLYISAAGADSSVMQRIKSELASQFKLDIGADEGDLWLRIRPTRTKNGWNVLIRITPRPLATRAWRVQDMPGALNASVAHAMVVLTQPRPTDTCLNIGSGSGTILIERLRQGSAQAVLGCDLDPAMMTIARTNLDATPVGSRASLVVGDARALPLEAGSVSAVLADLPFGQLVGSHAYNQVLYPALLAEAGRVAQSGALFVLITHEIRLIETVLAQSALWNIKETRMITLRGLHPRIYVLQRR